MDDLTVLYISASQMPKPWRDYQIEALKRAIGDTPIVSVTRKPLALGTNLIDRDEKSYWNIYMQMLRAAEVAETPYVAMAEDDTLYSPLHFTQFRPKPDEVSYNRARWSLFAWHPIYCMRQRISNCSLIAPREYLVDALRERRDKWAGKTPPGKIVGEVGRAVVDKRLRVSPRKCVEWWSDQPVIQLNHRTGTDEFAQRHWKKHGQIKAIDIPFWGKAADIAKVYNDAIRESRGQVEDDPQGNPPVLQDVGTERQPTD